MYILYDSVDSSFKIKLRIIIKRKRTKKKIFSLINKFVQMYKNLNKTISLTCIYSCFIYFNFYFMSYLIITKKKFFFFNFIIIFLSIFFCFCFIQYLLLRLARLKKITIGITLHILLYFNLLTC